MAFGSQLVDGVRCDGLEDQASVLDLEAVALIRGQVAQGPGAVVLDGRLPQGQSELLHVGEEAQDPPEGKVQPGLFLVSVDDCRVLVVNVSVRVAIQQVLLPDARRISVDSVGPNFSPKIRDLFPYSIWAAMDQISTWKFWAKFGQDYFLQKPAILKLDCNCDMPHLICLLPVSCWILRRKICLQNRYRINSEVYGIDSCVQLMTNVFLGSEFYIVFEAN